MQYTTLLLAASAALFAHAQDDGSDPSLEGPEVPEEDQYLQAVCMPTNSSSQPDMNAPCNEVQAVQLQCMYGSSVGLSLFYGIFGNGSDSNSSSLERRQSAFDSDDGPLEQSNSTQRLCVCESQFFDLLQGCVACEKDHGLDIDETNWPREFFTSLSSSYCAASATPTVDLADFLNNYANSYSNASSTSATATATSSSSFSDPIGNKTDVSLYYTQSVTGSDAWVIAQATSTASNGSVVSTEPTTGGNTVSGQIQPTAGATSASGSGSAAAGSGTTSSHAGAMRTEAAAVAGVLGLAGLVVLL